MAKTISNVLTGVATLEVAAPAGNRAEWSTEQFLTGSHSVKLSKISGDYGSTSVKMTASGAAAALTLQNFEDQAGGALEWGYMSWRSATNAYWAQLEYRFKDPTTESYVDVTIQIDVMALGGAAWLAQSLTDADMCGIYGWSEMDGAFADFAIEAISGVVAKVDAAAPLQVVASGSATDWTLEHVKVELWETVPPMTGGHVEFIDGVYLNSVFYNFEPGDAETAGIVLSAPYTEVGYTEDGVTMTYTADEADIDVEEETFSIDRVITKETCEVTCNMAESSLFNIDKAMAGSLLSGSILKLGAGTNKKITLQIRGTNPAGYTRAIMIPSCTATGAVGMSYRKGEKTVVPVTFQALKTADHPAVTIVDNAL
ncbi:MAG TPA: hypothetical protein VMW86_10345 [Dehalococcoidales bacterium]|nr:hypothetical protein [Dehalococcoidales bacterium]